MGIFSNTRKSQKKLKFLRVLVRRPSCWFHYDRSYCRYGEDSQKSTLNLLLIKKILGNKGILLSSYYLTLLTLQFLTVSSPQRSYIIPRWVKSFFKLRSVIVIMDIANEESIKIIRHALSYRRHLFYGYNKKVGTETD